MITLLKQIPDCEVILPLYQKYGSDFLNIINGIFAFFYMTILINHFLSGIYSERSHWF